MAPRARKDADASANGVGHNKPPLTEEEREAAALRHLDAMRQARRNSETAREAYKAVHKVELKVRNAAKIEGISLKIVDEILADEAKTRADLAAYEEQRAYLRSTQSLPNGRRADLFDSMEPEQRTEAEWGDYGYAMAIQGKTNAIPAEMPPEFAPTFLKRWAAGDERLAWARAEKGENPEAARSDVRLGSQVPADEPEHEEA